MRRKALLLVTVFAEGGLFALALLLIRFSQLEMRARLNVTWSATGYALFLCLPLLVLLSFFDRSAWEPIARFRREVKEKIVPIIADSKQLPDLALIALLAGAGEELFFRGWLQGILTNKLEMWSGILVASVIFGLLHYLSFSYAVYAFLTGVYLGVIYQTTGNLYIVMLIHGLYDFIALVYLLSQSKGKETNVIGREKG